MAVTLCECYFSTKMQRRRKVSRFQDVLSLEAMRSGLPKPTHRLTGNPCLDFPRRIIPMDSRGILDVKGRFQWLLML